MEATGNEMATSASPRADTVHRTVVLHRHAPALLACRRPVWTRLPAPSCRHPHHRMSRLKRKPPHGGLQAEKRFICGEGLPRGTWKREGPLSLAIRASATTGGNPAPSPAIQRLRHARSLADGGMPSFRRATSHDERVRPPVPCVLVPARGLSRQEAPDRGPDPPFLLESNAGAPSSRRLVAASPLFRRAMFHDERVRPPGSLCAHDGRRPLRTGNSGSRA